MLLVETGGKWWLKHVLAPMIAGGSVVPILLAMTNQLALTSPQATSASPNPIAPASAVGEDSSTKAPAQNTPAPVPPAASPPSPNANQAASRADDQPASSQPASDSAAYLPAQPAAAPANDTHLASFYASDRYSERYHGSRVRVKKGSLINLHWAVAPGAVSGIIHLRWLHDGRIVSDIVVPASGSRSVEVGTSMKWTLSEVRRDGERSLGNLDLSLRN